MLLSEIRLRHLIQEVLLQEEVFGAQAIVYHGTATKDPRKLIDAIMNTPGTWPAEITDVQPGGDYFRPGEGEGAMYGKGLYTVYDLAGTQTGKGGYGSYILKLKVNLDGFIIFDPDVAVKVYGSALSPAEQAKGAGMRHHIVEKLKEFNPDPYKNSSDGALWASKFLQYEAKGLVYTGGNDGRCVLIYDPATVVPMAWKKLKVKPDGAPPDIIAAPVDTWIPVTRDAVGEFRPEIRDAARRSASGAYEEGRYDTRSPEQVTIDSAEIRYGDIVKALTDENVNSETKRRISRNLPLSALEGIVIEVFEESQAKAAAISEILVDHTSSALRSFALLFQMTHGIIPLPPENDIVDIILNLTPAMLSTLEERIHATFSTATNAVRTEVLQRPVIRALIVASNKSKSVKTLCDFLINNYIFRDDFRDDRNDSCEDLVQILTASKDPVIRAKANLFLGDKSGQEASLRILVDDKGSWSGLSDILRNKFFDQESRGAAMRLIMREFRTDNQAVQEVARAPNIPPDVLKVLVSSDDYLTRAALAENPTSPPEILASIAEEGDMGLNRRLVRNPSTPSAALARFENGVLRGAAAGAWDNVHMLKDIVSNPNISPDVLMEIIKQIVVAHRGRPKYREVKKSAAQNPSAPDLVLDLLVNDEDKYVSNFIKTIITKRQKALAQLAKGSKVKSESSIRSLIHQIVRTKILRNI